jgi:hypothetical protein
MPDDNSKIVHQHSNDSAPKSSVPPRASISSPLPLRSSLAAESKLPSTPPANSSKGKRKADEVEGNTPPDVRKQKTATFADDPRPHRGSAGSSHAPSSYTRKRARLSPTATVSTAGLASSMPGVEEAESSGSRPPSNSSTRHQNAGNAGTWNSSRSHNAATILRSQSRTSQNPSHVSQSRNQSNVPSVRASSRRGSISQASIPISALLSPHAPSISHSPSSVFHMRDPRKPPKTQSTPWTLAFPQASHGEQGYLAGRYAAMLESGFFQRENINEPKEEHLGWYEGGGSPPHAWLFFLGFIVFPVWWIAAFLKIRRTRRIEGGHDGQKSVVLDDPQVEHDAKSWRKRCRVMGAVSLVTYIPFIVLVAIFAPR